MASTGLVTQGRGLGLRVLGLSALARESVPVDLCGDRGKIGVSAPIDESSARS